jgi:uncharacterized integral membrane protein
MNWINILVVLLFTSLATLFAISNTTPVRIYFMDLASGNMPLFVPIFVTFLLGFLGGMLSLYFSRRKHKLEIRRLREENSMLQKEVNNLRNLPLQDEA